MKTISFLTAFLIFFAASFASNNFLKDTTPPNINKYTKELFLNKYGSDETSQKLIRYYYAKHKSAKKSLYFFPALIVLSGIYLAVLSGASYPGTADDGYIFLAILGVGYVVSLFLMLSILAWVNRKKYSPQKLYNKVIDYQGGKPLSNKLKRKIKFF